MVQNKCDFINKLLFYQEPDATAIPSHYFPLAFFVHSSIIEKWKSVLHKLPVKCTYGCDIFERKLQIGEKCFDMRVSHITREYYQNRRYIDILIENSQVSFPWEVNPTLFINKNAFYILQQFIANHKLEAYTLKIEVQSGISVNDDTIKVVTFHQSVNESDIIEKYKNHLKTFETYRPPKYYYMTHAFQWQQPARLKHFQLPIIDELYSVILIILNHLGRLKYATELNIFDLLKIRFALCDFRNPLRSRIVQYEIDFMIKRELFNNVKNNNLDLEQYMIANNCTQTEVLFDWLVYEFQNYFETITINNRLGALNGGMGALKARKLNRVIDLAHETDVLCKIKQKSNIEFDIDGHDYDQMSLSLFLDLVECHNVRRIYLDTNYRWSKNACHLNRSMPKNYFFIYLLGPNTYNFIEDFVSSVKVIPRSKKILLKLNCTLNDYSVLDQLKIQELEFLHIKINAHMLVGLQKCKFKSKINFVECTFENARHNWALINNSRKLGALQILEDQDTWQPVFEFISNELISSNSKIFRFNDKTNIVIRSGDKQIYLKDIIFTIDEAITKLEIRNKMNGQPIDLYNLKYSLQSDDKSDYDFYQ